MGFLIDPFVSFDTIDRDEMNRLLVQWDHKMGPLNRPQYGKPIDFVVRRHGDPVAVIACDTLIRETCELTRNDAFELSRLCGPERGMCSMAMKLWRQFAYPEIARAWFPALVRDELSPWVISYQDATRHAGTLYRYDHWLVLGYSSGGSDPRAAAGTVNARKRVIWGWNANADAMAERRKLEIKKPAWAERIAP